MQDIDPRMVAAIVAMMQQQAQQPPSNQPFEMSAFEPMRQEYRRELEQSRQAERHNPMPPAEPYSQNFAGSIGAGALSGGIAGGVTGVGALPGAVSGGLVGLVAEIMDGLSPRGKATRAYNNEYGPGNQI